jgi:hypothetical protein
MDSCTPECSIPPRTHAIEVKRKARLQPADYGPLKAFLADYPMAKAWLVYGGSRRLDEGEIQVFPVEEFLRGLREQLG